MCVTHINIKLPRENTIKVPPLLTTRSPHNCPSHTVHLTTTHYPQPPPLLPIHRVYHLFPRNGFPIAVLAALATDHR
eukprot:scaffold10576_cov74-Phaeocystis_antarctica.AAC.2